MDLFNVTCTTCRASLKVRHLSAVGQILACPRCGSMVEIAPPPGWQPPAAAEPPTGGEPDLAPQTAAAESAAEDHSGASNAESGAIPDAMPAGGRRRWPLAVGLLLLATLAVVAVWMSIPGTAPLAHGPGGEVPPHPPKAGPPEPGAAGSETEEVSGNPPQANAAVDGADAGPSVASQGDAPIPESLPPDGEPVVADPADEAPWPEVEAEPLIGDEADPGAEGGASDPAASDDAGDSAPTAEPPAEDASDGDDRSSEDPQTPPPLPVIDVAARWAEPLAGVEIREQALVGFLNLVSRITTVPITLDLAGLRLAGMSPATPVSFTGPATTVGAAAEAALATLGLAAVPAMDDVWVTPQAFLVEQTSTKVYPAIRGLGERGPEAVEAIVTLVAPESWAAQGGPGTCQWSAEGLSVTQVPRLQAEVARIWESLDAASGPPGGRGSPAVDPPWIEFEKLMATPLTASFFRETPLGDVADHLARQTGWPWAINHRALAEAGMSAQVPLRLSARGEPLEAALGPALAPWRLALAAPAPGVVEITTVTAAQQPTTEVYPLVAPPAAELAAADVAEQLAAHLAAEVPDLAGQVTLRTLPGVAAVMVRAPASGHRRVAAWWIRQGANRE